ncbi:MAG: HlyD family type I secretion periplasmic adaptor subunit [Alphaproteobacteria bacterium]
MIRFHTMLPRWKKNLSTPDTIAQELPYLSQSALLEENHIPRIMRSFIRIISVSTLAFILWAAITRVNEIARADGEVVPSTYVQTVQHLEGGILRDIRVKEGDHVQQGDLLLVLEGAGSSEDLAELQSRQQSLRLQAKRLRAFADGKQPDFSGLGDNKEAIAQQVETLEAMERSRASEADVLKSQVEQKEKELAILRTETKTLRNNLALAEEARNIQKRLLDDGLTNRTVYLQRQEQVNTLSGKLSTTAEKITKAEDTLQEFRHRLENTHASHRDKALQMLEGINAEIARNEEILLKHTKRVQRLHVRAPASGMVKGMTVHTLGGVIGSGQTLMEIVPMNEQLEVEVRLSPKQIGHIETGQPVQVKVDAFDYTRYGVINGTLTSISATTFTDEMKQSYYRARIKLARPYLGDNPSRLQLIPGMTVDADIITGEKTIMAYLLKPVRAASSTAFTEK